MTDIVVHELCKSFGDKQVLQNFSVVFPAGIISGIAGPSGSGKTTLLRLLLGLETPDSGRIEGVPDRAAVVFQEDRLFEEFTPMANVLAVLPGKSALHRQRTRDCLCALGLSGSLSLPVHSLSGGMKRRVAIARALLAPGELLALDEPFTGLDAATRDVVITLLQSLRRERTTLLITHDPDALRALAHCTVTLTPG